MGSDDIVVLGAGVIGLQVATILAEQGFGRQTTIVAEHLPGDTSTSYTSPWAGANFSAISGNDANALRWDKNGYSRLMEMASTNSAKSFVRKTKSTEYWDEKPSEAKIASMATYLQDFRVLSSAEIPDGAAFGVTFTTVTLNAPQHIQYLMRRLRENFGVKVIRRKLPSLQAAFLSERTSVVFNCIGNAARDLPGVEDQKCFPTRGQILLARAPQITTNTMRHGRNYETYIIPRPHSQGKVILGGFMQKHRQTGDTFGEESEDIWQRTSGLLPELKSNETEILASFSGLRPSREGGARVERELLRSEGQVGQARVVVHNYGAGGTGFQAGYGMAEEAVQLAQESLTKLTRTVRAHL